MTSHKIDPDGIKRISGKREKSRYGLLLIEIFDKNNKSTIKIGYDCHVGFEVILEASERIVGIAAHIDSDK
jgi:hypothetical protein